MLKNLDIRLLYKGDSRVGLKLRLILFCYTTLLISIKIYLIATAITLIISFFDNIDLLNALYKIFKGSVLGCISAECFIILTNILNWYGAKLIKYFKVSYFRCIIAIQHIFIMFVLSYYMVAIVPVFITAMFNNQPSQSAGITVSDFLKFIFELVGISYIFAIMVVVCWKLLIFVRRWIVK